MFSLSKPSPDAIRAFLSAQTDRELSYEHVGSSRTTAPNGCVVDHNRVQLGVGRAVFARAKNAVRQWKMFDMTWLELCWPDVPTETGATVAIVVRHLGFWSLNACRIVYTIEQGGAVEKYGFAYGTLPDHSEMGEERFSVEFHAENETVWYDIYAFSRPRALARLAYPYTRALQKRFAEDSKKAMKRAVESA
ncbi:MAG: DUF1990 domain-containing protein [Candidatus Acidiferrales bacterium]